MWDSGTTALRRAQVPFTTQITTFTKANGTITRRMEKECTKIARAPDMRANSKRINNTEKALKLGRKELNIKVFTKLVLSMAKVITCGLIAASTLVNGRITKYAVSEFTCGMTIDITTETGLIMICMA